MRVGDVEVDILGIELPETTADRFHVPKTPVPVRLRLEGGLELEGHVHLAGERPEHLGRERVFDLLTSAEPFFPLTVAQGARLINRQQIVMASVPGPDDAGVEEVEITAPAVGVAIVLTDLPPEQACLTGMIHIIMPPGQTRLIDYLNSAKSFFPVETSSGFALVSTSHVREIRQR